MTFIGMKTPAGIRCQNDVVLTSMRHHHVASTLIRRHFYIMCPLGRMWPEPVSNPGPPALKSDALPTALHVPDWLPCGRPHQGLINHIYGYHIDTEFRTVLAAICMFDEAEPSPSLASLSLR